jgi:hypothetical protein
MLWYTPRNSPSRFLYLEHLHLSPPRLTAPSTPTLFLVSSPFIGGHTPLIRCLCNSSSFHPCIGKVFACCLHQEHKRLPVVQPLHSLCSKLHLGTLLLLAPVVSLQYLIGSYGYSYTIFVCPRAISVLQISPYSLLLCLTAVHPVTILIQVKIGCQSLSPCCVSLQLSGSLSILLSRNHSHRIYLLWRNHHSIRSLNIRNPTVPLSHHLVSL